MIHLWHLQLDDNHLPLRPAQTFHIATIAISSLSFSSDGQALATNGQDGSIFVWDVQTGQLNQCLQMLHEHTSWVMGNW